MSKALLLEAMSKINENVMTPEVKKTIVEAFDSAVEIKANEKLESLQESIVSAVESHLETIAKAHVYDLNENMKNASAEMAKELSEAYAADLQKELSAKFDFDTKCLIESVDRALQVAVNEAMEEIKPDVQAEVDVAKAKKIQESAIEFGRLFGIALQEAEKSEEEKDALEKEKAKAKDLEDEITTMKKDKVISEAVQDLTAVQAEKLKSLLESVPFVDVDGFKEKVSVMKSIVATKGEDKKTLRESVSDGASTKVASWKK